MARSPCFVKNGQDAPICGVHNVPLVQHDSSEFPIASKFGDFVFFVCPVSGLVLNDSATNKQAGS
jgi:hypothetical protein